MENVDKQLPAEGWITLSAGTVKQQRVDEPAKSIVSGNQLNQAEATLVSLPFVFYRYPGSYAVCYLADVHSSDTDSPRKALNLVETIDVNKLSIIYQRYI